MKLILKRYLAEIIRNLEGIRLNLFGGSARDVIRHLKENANQTAAPRDTENG